MDAAAGPRPLVIRNYQSTDWGPVYDVCVRTGDRGGDASLSFQQPEVVPDVFAGPYLYLEPELAFVVDDGDRPVGYVLGTADTAGFVTAYRDEWLPRMTPRYPQTAVAPFASNDDLFVYLMYWPERMLVAEVLPAYPAHLHIDLLPPHQGKGFGRKLIQAFASAAGRAGAPGVHVTVSNENERAHGFYLKVGFTKLDVPGAEDDGVTYYGLETA